jgi:TfoX/Sxy family transcriptional regulator of competence genes
MRLSRIDVSARGSPLASKQSVVDYILGQLAGAGPLTARKMFGEFSIYAGFKLVALVADDQLFVKPTTTGKAFLGQLDERPPYPGAKPWLWIGGERWDDSDWLSEFVRITAAELPVPLHKKPKDEQTAKARPTTKAATKKPASRKPTAKKRRRSPSGGRSR